LERNAHTVGGQIESQAPGLGVQLDDGAILIVLEIGDRATLNDRHTSRDRRIVAAEICRTGQIVDLTLGGNAGGTYVSDRNTRDFELVLFLVFAVVKGPVTPAVSDPDGDRAAAEPQVGRRYSPFGNRRLPGRGASCRNRNAGHKDCSNKS